ncbi:MAG: hypothetical protein KAW90_01865, partial [Dehalococcoidales bacterium]|nr:hypothetical protein [Dehalococcoidales bacterium]
LLDRAGLLLSYSQIINLATESQYRNAQDILDELEHVDMPDDIRYIINQYSNLYQRLLTTLDNLEALLDEASGLLARNLIGEVKHLLDTARADIRDASTLSEDIEVATNSLSDKLGVFAISATSQLTQSHTRLEEGLERLSDLIDKLNSLNQSLTEQYVQKTRLIPTELSLSINPASAYVGDKITASGRLSSDGNPLTRRRITITLECKTMANTNNNVMVAATTNTTTTTRFDGTYVTSITLPYEYVDKMTLTAVYQPAGNDANIYLGSESPPVTITTMFYQTMLEVSSPERIYRGLPFTVSGTVTDNHDNASRNIKVLLDDTSLAEEVVSGPFSFEITLPEKTPLGTGKLTVAVSPQRRYSGASVQRSVTISVLSIYTDIRTPSIVLLPGDIQISGMVYSELGPVVAAPVSLYFKKSSTTVRTSADGSFSSVIKLHLMPEEAPLSANPFYISTSPADSSSDFSPIGTHEIEITVEPPKTWATTTNVKRQVFTINPLSTALILAILVALWLVIRRRSWMRTYTEKEIPPAEVVAVPAATPLPAPVPKLTGIKGQVLSAYRSVLATVEKISGVIMSPDITLREFLKTAQLPSPTATDRFAELTTITESTLYSAYSPQQDTAAKAAELATNIKEELRSGTT